MNLRKAIHRESVSISLRAREKTAILEEMVDLLMCTGQVRDRKAVLKAILERERKMSTAMHRGLAIPHGKTDAVDGLLAAVGLIPEGVDFESQDGEPSRIFILTVSPVNRAGPHIQFLAEISRILATPEIRQAILEADSPERLHHLLTES